jgi:hypothetical protein
MWGLILLASILALNPDLCSCQHFSMSSSLDHSFSLSQFLNTDSPTVTPTVAPTIPITAPTVAPTTVFVKTIMTYASQQSLQNCSYSQFVNSDTSQLVFRRAVASSTVSITVDDVTITSIADDSVGLRRLTGSGSEPSVAVEYNITLDVTGSSEYSSATAAFALISTKLAENVGNGQFSANLVTAATAAGDAAMKFTSSSSINIFQPAAVTVDLTPTAAPSVVPSVAAKEAPLKALLLPVGAAVVALLLLVMGYVFLRGKAPRRIIFLDLGTSPAISPDSVQLHHPRSLELAMIDADATTGRVLVSCENDYRA